MVRLLGAGQLDINIPRPQRVRLNKVPSRLHLIPHQHRKHPVRFDRVLDLHAQQAAHFGVHRGFPQLFGVHLAQALVALAAGGAFGFLDEPGHGLAEVAHFLFALALAFAAQHPGAFAEQAAEGVGGFGQGGVIGAVHEVLRDDAALDVAVVAAADAQHGLVGAGVEFAGHFGGHAGGGEFAQLGLQGDGAGFGVFHGIEVEGDAIGDRAQGLAVHEGGKAFDDGLGHLVLLRQGAEGFSVQGAGLFAAGGHAGVAQGHAQQEGVERGAVLQVQLFLAVLHLVERRLGDVDVAALDQLGHLAVEEGEQQGADVRAVHVGIGHDDDAVVAKLVHVEIVRAVLAGAVGARLADAGAQGGDERQDFVGGEQLLVARLLHVQDLAAQRQDGLELPVAALLGGAAGGVALDDVDLAQRRVLLLAVGELAGQAHAVEHALAARHLAGLARGLAGAGGLDDLAAEDLGVVGALFQVVRQRLGDDVFHGRAHFAGDELVLGLAAELGLGDLHAEHAAQAFAHVVAAHLDLGLLGQFLLLDVLADDARHGGAQAGQVGAAVALRDVVGEAEHLLAVAVVPLHGHFDADLGAGNAAVGFCRAAARGVEGGGVQHLLAGVDEVDEALDAAGAGEVVFLAGALVLQADAHAVVQERKLAQALGEDLVVEVVVLLEDLGVGQEVHFRAALVGLAGHAHGRDFDAVHRLQEAVLHEALAELQHVHLAVAAHREAQHLAERVHATHAHAVQAARDLVAVLVELAARMQFGERDLGRRALGLVLVVHLHAGGNAAAVVGDADGVVGVDGDDDVVAVAGQRLVDGVVHHFEHEVVQARAVRRVADVHARALAHGLQAFQDLDRAFAVPFAGAGLPGVDLVRGLRVARAVLGGLGQLVLSGHGWVASGPVTPRCGVRWGQKRSGGRRVRCASASRRT